MEPVGPFKTFPPAPQPRNVRIRNWMVASALLGIAIYTYCHSLVRLRPASFEDARPSTEND